MTENLCNTKNAKSSTAAERPVPLIFTQIVCTIVVIPPTSSVGQHQHTYTQRRSWCSCSCSHHTKRCHLMLLYLHAHSDMVLTADRGEKLKIIINPGPNVTKCIKYTRLAVLLTLILSLNRFSTCLPACTSPQLNIQNSQVRRQQ